MSMAGADPGFQVRGGALTKIAPCGGRRENLWGISCEKSRFYAKKSYSPLGTLQHPILICWFQFTLYFINEKKIETMMVYINKTTKPYLMSRTTTYGVNA
jgi:hypothetical protein